MYSDYSLWSTKTQLSVIDWIDLCFISESSQNGTVLMGETAYPALEETKSALEVNLCCTLWIYDKNIP